MTALYIILGIIAFFILVLSIRISVLIEYKEYIELSVRWLFIKKRLLPLTSKQLQKKQKKEQKKEKKKAEGELDEAEKEAAAGAEEVKKAAEKAETVSEEFAKEVAKENPAAAAGTDKKQPSLLKELWNVHGYDGLVKMLRDSVNALNRFFGNCFRSIVIDELFYGMRVAKGDASETAIAYGKACSELYPLFGAIISKLKTKDYDINIYPDYLANKSESSLHLKLLVCPRKIINAAIGLAFRLLFKVVLKVLITLFKKPKSNQNNKNNKSSKGGASV